VANDGGRDLAVTAEARALADELRGAFEGYRAGWRRFYDQLTSSLAARNPGMHEQLVRLLTSDFPEAFSEPEARGLASSLGLSPRDLRHGGALHDEDVALQVLKELADWYHTPQPLAGTEAIVGFGQKIQDALDALFAGYVPLRNGLRTFEAEFEVKQNPPDSVGSAGVGRAETQLEVGARALDWNDTRDGAHAFRSLFADLMVHNMSMISGVMKGAAALIKQFSPDALTETFEETRRAGRTGIAFGIFRYRELWRALELRHRDLVKEENETFTLLFGREFAATYQQFFSAASADANVAGRSARPAKRDAEPAVPRPAVANPPRTSATEKTPETHGQPPPRANGPTGTVIAPRIAAAAAPTGPMTAAADVARRRERS
jgi:type VI secretion system protein ImpI